MAERERFHSPGGHEHDQKDHASGGDGGGADPASIAKGLGYEIKKQGGRAGLGTASKDFGSSKEASTEVSRVEKALTGKGYKITERKDASEDDDESGPYIRAENRETGDALTIGSSKEDGSWNVEIQHRSIKKMSSDSFARIDGAEIFAAGTWNARDFSEADLDSIVAAFDFFQMSGQVPLKFGHNDEQPLTDGQPALGWVDRIWRDGRKLMADFRDVPALVYDAIKAGRYKNVSVELLRDVVAGTRTVPLVLDAVALLGADLPAVGTLRDLQALTMATRLQGRERLAFTQAFHSFSGDRDNMAENTQLEAELDKLRKQNERVIAELAEAKAAATSHADKFTKLSAETYSAKVADHRKAILALFEDAVRGKKIQAAVRERFLRRFKIETDDAGCMATPLSDVESYIRENPNPFLKMSAITSTGDPDEVPSGGLPDKELMARARRLCRDRGKDANDWEALKNAGIDIMRADPSLAERYRQLPDDHADGKYSA